MFGGVIPTPNPQPPDKTLSKITIWGTVPASQFRSMLKSFDGQYNHVYALNYKEVPEESLRNDLLEAIANNTAPDLVFFPHERFLSISDRLYPISTEVFSSREFKNTFAQVGEIFMGQNGIYAMPMAIDPLVLYWNRDILNSKEKINPPLVWQDVYDMSEVITEKDSVGNIGKGMLTIAMGEAKNVNWFKDILSLIFLQAGNKIVTTDSYNNLIPSLKGTDRTGSSIVSEAGEVIIFYTNFANVKSSHYTWTRGAPLSIDAFIAEKLALYIGRASDYGKIKGKNPHLTNFDVAQVPQLDSNRVPLTYASVFGMGVVNQGKNPPVAEKVLLILKDKKYSDLLANGMFLPPARKDSLQETQSDPFRETFYRSAEIGANWLDPNPEGTKETFKFLITNVADERVIPSQAISDASSNLADLLKDINKRNKNVQ